MLIKKIFFFGILTKLKREYLLNSELQDLIKKSTGDDILYFRFPLPSFALVRIFRKQRKCKIVMESQSIEGLQYLAKRQYIYAFIDRIFGGILIKHADGIVGVTHDITRYELKRSSSPDKAHLTIGNGFDVDSVKSRKSPVFNQEEFSILCVAQVDRWHGVDRIIAGIASHSGFPSVKLHIAGNGEELSNLKKMVEMNGLKDNVIFHGFVSGTALDELFDKCHIALGSIGLHRIGPGEVGSVLKHREYCARGIPFIVECSDHDFPEDFPYFNKVPADETPVSIEDIFQFTIWAFNDRDHPQKMHDYARKFLDWSHKMEKLKKFLENL